MSLNGKTPALMVMSDKNIVTVYNDAVQYEVQPMKLWYEYTAPAEGEQETDPDYTVVSPVKNRRCLLYNNSVINSYINPVRFVPMSLKTDLSETIFYPLYEAINPTIQYMTATGNYVMTFWTNFIAEVTEYDILKVKMFDETDLANAISDGETYYRALCTTSISIQSMYIQGGMVALQDGTDPSAATDDNGPVTFSGYDYIPVATLPTIVQLYADDYPIVDFASGAGDGGFRRHSHRDNSWYEAGYAFSVFHPGTGVPAKPWEVQST